VSIDPQPSESISQEAAALIGREAVAYASRQRESTKRHTRKKTEQRLDALKNARPVVNDVANTSN
jgi:hypothetical protein